MSVQSEIRYVIDTDKSVAHAAEALEAAAPKHGFGVLHQYDLKATLDSKGIGLDHECRVLEVCQPKSAREVLDVDMSMNMALPCRISVWEQGGHTHIGMIRPMALLEMLSDDPRLAQVAEDVERTMIEIIDDAKRA